MGEQSERVESGELCIRQLLMYRTVSGGQDKPIACRRLKESFPGTNCDYRSGLIISLIIADLTFYSEHSLPETNTTIRVLVALRDYCCLEQSDRHHGNPCLQYFLHRMLRGCVLVRSTRHPTWSGRLPITTATICKPRLEACLMHA